jgi:hypothetical protein
MPFDHDALSSSTQRGSLQASTSDERVQLPSQASRAHQPCLRSCIYVALRCSRCGAVRLAITELPAQGVLACPECGQECSFVLLGSGVTTRDLPFHEVHGIEPTRWVQPVEVETNSS